MISNYIRIAFRNLWRHKVYTLINIIGLAVGMAITLLSLLFVTNELSFDRFHENKERVYRLIVKEESSREGTTTSSIMTAGVGPSFLQLIPEVEKMVRVSYPSGGFISFEENNYEVNGVMYADSSFFNVFSFQLLSGNENTILVNPYSVVLTESVAQKVFEKENPVGKTIVLNNRDNCIITGIVEDPPPNSHLKFDALVSFTSLYENPNMHLGWNGGWSFCTYLLLYEGADPLAVEEQFIPIAEENINNENREIGELWIYSLQALSKVHLNTNVDWDLNTKGSWTTMFLFIMVTITILIIACINFVNLTTAISLSRLKEVGVRKVSGAGRRQIVLQFLTESMVVSILALVHAIILIEVFHLWMANRIADASFLQYFELYNRSFFQLIVSIVFLIVTVGIFAGTYPALFMSRFKPAFAVKGKLSLSGRSSVIQNLLVVFQFVIAIIFLISTLVISSQLNFLLDQDLGFRTDNKLIVPLTSESAKLDSEEIKSAFLQIPGVKSAGASSNVPGQGFTRNGYFPEGQDQPSMIHVLDVDYDYISAMGLKMVQGRAFSKGFGQDGEAYIINQALARTLGWDDAVGKYIRRGENHKVIGVVEDFNYSSLHQAVQPLIITLKPWIGYSFITLTMDSDPYELLPDIETVWSDAVPYEDFEAFTLSSHVAEAYGDERQYMTMLLFCAGLTIFIAGLGLFGLSAFITRRRYPEIAVRKVYGAGIKRIFSLISLAYLKWIFLANLIAWPLAYLIMDNYFLINYAYNNGIQWWIFIVALVFSVLISMLVIMTQLIRLSRLNPIDYIRYE